MTTTVMVLGADGMLGHRILLELAKDKSISLIAVTRTEATELRDSKLFAGLEAVQGFSNYDVLDWESYKGVISNYQPDYVINCIGIIKQREKEAKNTKLMIEVNAMFPHRLAEAVSIYGGVTINFSSDCIFLGDKVPPEKYTEQDQPDALSLYGRTKYLGEIGANTNSLTLRTSFIGFEIKGYTSLLEWFVGAAKGSNTIRGFTAANWSGVTTQYIAGLIHLFIREKLKHRGVYQLATPEPINKFNLLKLLSQTLSMKAEIVEDDHYEVDKVCNRHLDGTRFERDFGFTVIPIQEMVQGLREDYAIYIAAHPERYGR